MERSSEKNGSDRLRDTGADGQPDLESLAGTKTQLFLRSW